MTHSIGPIYEVSSNVPTETVDDYLIVPQDDPSRPAFYVSGDLYTQLATTRETNFNFNVFDFFIPVGGGAPAHVHSFDDEVWYIADGEVQYNLGNQGTDSIIVPEGGVVFGPVDKTHGFLNVDSTTSVSGVTPGARTISTTTPGLLDLFFSGAGTKVEDRNIPVPGSEESTEEGFINPEIAFKIGARTDSVIGFVDLGLDDYVPPEEALDYVIVLPEDAEEKFVERALELSEVEGFSVWTTGNHEGLPQRPTFIGDFGIEYTSLVNLEETGNKFSYNQFTLEPQEVPETFDVIAQANLTGSQVIEPTESQATGTATLELNSEGNIDYSLTISNLDFGEWAEEGTPQTPDSEHDDVTAIHIHTGEQGINGPHAFNVLATNEQDETDLDIAFNEDDSVTLSGIWSQNEKEIPESLIDFFDGGVPRTESDFYFQVHTEANPTGEIRGQITNATDDDLVSEDSTSSLLGDQIFGEYNVSGVFEEIENLVPPETNLYNPVNEFINIVPPTQEEQPFATVTEPGVEFRTRALEQTYVDFTESGFSIEILPNSDEEFVEQLFLELGLEPQPAIGTKTLDQAFKFSDLDFANSSDSISEVVLLDSNFPELDLDWTEDSISVSFPGVVLTEEGFFADFEIVTQNDESEPISDESEPIISEDHQYFYVTEGQLSVTIGDEVKIADEDNFVYVAPGNEYSIANYGEETVESLAVSIVDQESSFPEGTVLEELDGISQIFGGAEDDELLASSNQQLFGGNGDDFFGVRQGGNNLFYGGSGVDTFEIAHRQLPNAVEFQYPEDIESVLPDGFAFPDLVDTGNRIADFELGVDKIQITGEDVASSFDDLELLPAFGDLGSTSIIATVTENGVEKEISLADISGVIFTELSADDFIFA